MQIEANPDETPKIPVYFLFIFIVIGFSVYQFTNSWGWAIGVGFASYLIIGTYMFQPRNRRKKNGLINASSVASQSLLRLLVLPQPGNVQPVGLIILSIGKGIQR